MLPNAQLPGCCQDWNSRAPILKFLSSPPRNLLPGALSLHLAWLPSWAELLGTNPCESLLSGIFPPPLQQEALGLWNLRTHSEGPLFLPHPQEHPHFMALPLSLQPHPPFMSSLLPVLESCVIGVTGI